MIHSSEEEATRSGRHELELKRANASAGSRDPLADLWKTSSPSQRLELLRHVLPVLAPEDLLDAAELQRPQRPRSRRWLLPLIAVPLAVIGLSCVGLWLGLGVPLDLRPANAFPQTASPPALPIRVEEPTRLNPPAMDRAATVTAQLGTDNQSADPANGAPLPEKAATVAAREPVANGKSFWTKPR